MADAEATGPVEVVTETISQARQKQLKEYAARIQKRRARYQLYHDYNDGKHRVRLTPRARRYLQASGLQYAHNFTDIIVDSLVQRLQITGVSLELEHVDEEEAGILGKILQKLRLTPTDEETTKRRSLVLTRWLRRTLEANCFDQLQNIAHDGAVKLGDGYATGWYREGEGARITVNRAESCCAVYSDADCIRPEAVAKLWTEDGAGDGETARQRLNVYYADRVEKYARPSGDGDWTTYTDEPGEVWPMRTMRANTPDQPLGLAMIHLRNKNRGRWYGTSEIHKAIPQQDAINKRMVDLDLVSDNQGYSQRWATGVAKSSPTLSNHPGAWWRFEGKDVKVGQFPAGDLTQLISAIDMSVKHFSGTNQTPYHLLNLSGAMPSGEALKSAEAPLVKKVADRQQTFADCWRDLIRLLIRLAVDAGELSLSPEEEASLSINITWASAESRDQKGEWEVVGLKQAAGVSQHTTLLEMDYEPDTEAERRAGEQGALGAAMLQSFEAGTGEDTQVAA